MAVFGNVSNGEKYAVAGLHGFFAGLDVGELDTGDFTFFHVQDVCDVRVQMNLIFSFLRNRFCMIFEARS